MATVEVKSYHDQYAAQSVNNYISEGHDGPVCMGHNCPQEAEQATEYMDTLREMWDATRGPSMASPAHYQIWLSWAEGEKPMPVEMLDMGRELVTRTRLRNYAAFLAAHLNTDSRHVHISLCPFPDTRDGDRLVIDDDLKRELRKVADHICVEHGYSIVDVPSLRQDADYKQWFEQVKSDGRVTIRPMTAAKRQPLDEQISEANARAGGRTEQKKERADR